MERDFIAHTPPGISLLVTTIFQGSLLPLTLGTLDLLVLRPNKVHTLPTWVTVITCLLSPLAAFSIQLLSRDFIVYVKARRVGAVLPPHNPTWVPGAIHKIIGSLKAEETFYPGNILADMIYVYLPPVLGDPLEDLIRKFGHTFNLRALFTDRVRPSDMNHQNVHSSNRCTRTDLHSRAGVYQSLCHCLVSRVFIDSNRD